MSGWTGQTASADGWRPEPWTELPRRRNRLFSAIPARLRECQKRGGESWLPI